MVNNTNNDAVCVNSSTQKKMINKTLVAAK